MCRKCKMYKKDLDNMLLLLRSVIDMINDIKEDINDVNTSKNHEEYIYNVFTDEDTSDYESD